MITLKDFMELVNYRITEGNQYGWICFGRHSYQLDSWNGELDGHTVSIVFDTRTQVVYQAEAFDFKRQRAYRIINPDWKQAFDNEVQDRDILDMAWENDEGNPVRYTTLETDEDFIEKARAIIQDIDYDTRVQVPLNLDKDEMYKLMSMAHERDMTLNQFVEEVLQHQIERIKNERR